MRRNQIITAFVWAVILAVLTGTAVVAPSSRGMAAGSAIFHGGAGRPAGIAGAYQGGSNHVVRMRHSNFGVANGYRGWGYLATGGYGAYYPDNGEYLADDGGATGMPPYAGPIPPACPNPFAAAAMFLNCGGPYAAPEVWPVRPPIGAVTPILPDGAAYEYVDGVSYYIRGGAYYRPRVTRNGIVFEVVRTPS